jgi:NAD+ synthase (glutamine-hydrolysing)
MDTFVRVSLAAFPVRNTRPLSCIPSAMDVIRQAAALHSDLTVLPACALGGASGGSLLQNRTVVNDAREALRRIQRDTADIDSYLLIGYPDQDSGSYVVLYRGQILAQCTRPDPLKPPPIFLCGQLPFAVMPNDPSKLVQFGACALQAGAKLLVVPSAQPVRAGSVTEIRKIAESFTRSGQCAVCVINGGIGETSSPSIFMGVGGIYECGRELCFDTVRSAEGRQMLCTADLDGDILGAGRAAPVSPVFNTEPHLKSRLLRTVEKNPFLPADYADAEEYLEELFYLQADALSSRMKNTGIQKLVVGASGGVDSTLALLVCAKSLDALGLPRNNMIGITMPGFGTSGRTYSNSLAIIDGVGAELREVSIKEAVLQHFSDIGQDPAVHDVTYENAQARARTHILLDLANRENALVVGTGDLSEVALGWCTFGGDHLASFNVNASVTKTVARAILRMQAASRDFKGIGHALLDVLDTPVSPELLPPSAGGEIRQCTEEILGPYELHEFFLYYFVRYGMPPSKILRYACAAFDGDYKPEEIRRTLQIFIRRFFSGQFKRNCSPEGPALTDVSLSPACFWMPADLSAKAMLEELERPAEY